MPVTRNVRAIRSDLITIITLYNHDSRLILLTFTRHSHSILLVLRYGKSAPCFSRLGYLYQLSMLYHWDGSTTNGIVLVISLGLAVTTLRPSRLPEPFQQRQIVPTIGNRALQYRIEKHQYPFPGLYHPVSLYVSLHQKRTRITTYPWLTSRIGYCHRRLSRHKRCSHKCI